MILIVFLVVTGLLALAATLLTDSYSDFLNILGILCGIFAVLSFIAFVIFGFWALVENVGVEGSVAAMAERYESLKYQAENNIYDNDNDIGKRELVTEIQKWNEDLATGKTLYDNFWVGIFYPKALYENFEPISMSTIK